jgi:xylan 1,4-beta-xylosidase|tara:strand:- start:2870 stop:4489 length:1620 start_codon:yes stop_codon:yes gene_type:complete
MVGNEIINVTVDATKSEPLRRIWTFVGYDEPNYTYTNRGKELLAKLGGMSSERYFVRCHFLLCTGDGVGSPKWGSTNVYTEDKNGQAIYDFTILDQIFDAYLENGCIPFVELGFMPKALVSSTTELVYEATSNAAWGCPPTDYGSWHDLIAAIAEHCLERYGLREVRRWYWELWNEPDLWYWQGTVEEYCKLYDYTVAGLHSVLPQANIGGPATTGPAKKVPAEFLRRFLEHCSVGTNAVTGLQGTRLDFVSFHAKGGGYKASSQSPKQTPSIFNLVRHVETGLNILSTFPNYRGLEVIVSECDPDGWAAGSRHDNQNLEFRNTEYYGSYLANTVCQLMDLREDGPNQIDGMLTWAFQFENREYFEGLRTLSTNGLDKPVLNVFRLLSRLNSLRLKLTSAGHRDPLVVGSPDHAHAPPDVSGLATKDNAGSISVFLSCHHDDWDVHSKTKLSLQFHGLEFGRYKVQESIMDESNANSYSKWVELGQPTDPSETQIAEMKSAALLRPLQTGTVDSTDGSLSILISMKSHSVRLVELKPTS